MPKIFESPDGGETVYAREIGSTDRTLHSESPKIRSLHDDLKELQLWGNIKRAAADNPALQKAVEQCILLYKLTKHYEERYGNRKT